jgi:hypothetical protein
MKLVPVGLRLWRSHPLPVLLIWTSLVLAFGFALWERQWPLAYLAAMTYVLTLVPLHLVRRVGLRLPRSFTVGIVLFIYATIFLGEAFDFYDRYWWWDIVMHGGSAIGFGMLGFLVVFLLFAGDRYAAPAWAMSVIGFTFAVTIGALWEIFEYAMDRSLGLNMQKSGLRDTMGDLIVDVVGGALGALMGYLYLKRLRFAGFTRALSEFVAQNARLFRR